jgi:hypothetical protein
MQNFAVALMNFSRSRVRSIWRIQRKNEALINVFAFGPDLKRLRHLRNQIGLAQLPTVGKVGRAGGRSAAIPSGAFAFAQFFSIAISASLK